MLQVKALAVLLANACGFYVDGPTGAKASTDKNTSQICNSYNMGGVSVPLLAFAPDTKGWKGGQCLVLLAGANCRGRSECRGGNWKVAWQRLGKRNWNGAPSSVPFTAPSPASASTPFGESSELLQPRNNSWAERVCCLAKRRTGGYWRGCSEGGPPKCTTSCRLGRR